MGALAAAPAGREHRRRDRAGPRIRIGRPRRGGRGPRAGRGLLERLAARALRAPQRHRARGLVALVGAGPRDPFLRLRQPRPELHRDERAAATRTRAAGGRRPRDRRRPRAVPADPRRYPGHRRLDDRRRARGHRRALRPGARAAGVLHGRAVPLLGGRARPAGLRRQRRRRRGGVPPRALGLLRALRVGHGDHGARGGNPVARGRRLPAGRPGGARRRPHHLPRRIPRPALLARAVLLRHRLDRVRADAGSRTGRALRPAVRRADRRAHAVRVAERADGGHAVRDACAHRVGRARHERHRGRPDPLGGPRHGRPRAPGARPPRDPRPAAPGPPLRPAARARGGRRRRGHGLARGGGPGGGPRAPRAGHRVAARARTPPPG